MTTSMKTSKQKRLTAQIAATIFATALTGAVMAGSETAPPTSQHPNAADAAAAQISDTQLKNFADAQEEVDEIRSKYVEKVKDEQDPQDRAEAESAMQEEMATAVKENDLDVPTYNRIAQLLPLSNGLQQRLEQQQ